MVVGTFHHLAIQSVGHGVYIYPVVVRLLLNADGVMYYKLLFDYIREKHLYLLMMEAWS